MNVATVVKYLRTKNGLSQEEFAVKLGVVRQTVSRWEKGTAEPALVDIKNMCRLFGVAPKFFFDGESPLTDDEMQSDCTNLCAKGLGGNSFAAESESTVCKNNQPCAECVAESPKYSSAGVMAEAVSAVSLTTGFVPEPQDADPEEKEERGRVIKLRALLAAFWISCVLFIGMLFCSVVVGNTVFSGNQGFDKNADFEIIDFVIYVLLTLLFFAVSALIIVFRRRLKQKGR